MEGVCSSLAHFLLGNINWPGRTYTPGIKQPSLQLPRVYSGQGSGLGCCSDNGADFLLVPKMLRRDQLHNKGRSKVIKWYQNREACPQKRCFISTKTKHNPCSGYRKVEDQSTQDQGGQGEGSGLYRGPKNNNFFVPWRCFEEDGPWHLQKKKYITFSFTITKRPFRPPARDGWCSVSSNGKLFGIYLDLTPTDFFLFPDLKQ